MTDARTLILVVDDDDDVRETVLDALEVEGYDVVGASNGQRALDVLRSAEPRPSLILLDLMMPVMDGEEFRRQQLLDADLSHIPVVIISAHASSDSICEALRVDGYLRKPVELDRLYDIAARLT